MNPFHYLRATSPEHGLTSIRHLPAASYLAGGTTLLDLMKEGVEQPNALVDINSLPIAEFNQDNAGITVGAMVRNSDLANHPLIRERFPVLSQALLSGASPQIRNMASVGGNLLQRTRCPYFRDPSLPCNKRQPGSGCGALDGQHRNHAILGTSERCIATHPSDMAVALTALNAQIQIQSIDGHKTVAIRDFYRQPKDTPHVESTLTRGDLILGIRIPWLPSNSRSTYIKVRDRASYEFALASAAVALTTENGRVTRAHIALGGVGTIPWHCRGAEQVLLGSTVGEEAFRSAAEAALETARPHKQNAFKVELAKRTLIRALTEVTESHA